MNVLKLCPHQRKFLLSNFDTRDWNLDLINLVNCWNNWLHQKKLLEALKGKCFLNILLLELNNLLFEQFTVYCLNNLLFERFTVKCLNTLIFKNCMILRNILYSPEDRRHRETQSCELCSISFSLNWIYINIYFYLFFSLKADQITMNSQHIYTNTKMNLTKILKFWYWKRIYIKIMKEDYEKTNSSVYWTLHQPE